MIEREHERSVGRQAKALGISRGRIHHLPPPTPEADPASRGRMDELHREHPFAGSRRRKGLLKAEGHKAGRLHAATLTRKRGLEAIHPRPNTSKPAPGHKVCSYRLRNLAGVRPNQLWAMDIAYIPMARGFVH